MRGLRMLKFTVARRDKTMSLTRLERERITDSRLKIQAITESLNGVDPDKIPDMENIQECLQDAERTLRGALRLSDATK